MPTEIEREPRLSPLFILEHRPYLRICAPMVRYSKLPFRELVRNYGTDVVFTPMILADSFKNSQIARDMEYRTTSGTRDTPVVVQFAAKNAKELADAAELVAPYCNGVDINCGCPQKWAYKEHIGSYLMGDPELVSDMISQVKSRTATIHFKSPTTSGFPCSVKIRIHPDIQRTVEFARRAEKAGADWISVHGRTRHQKSSEPVDVEAIKAIKSSVQIPVFANGDICSLKDADETVASTGCDGVMSARGLLANPALFAGYNKTPLECVEKFIRLSIGYGSNHFVMHHHLMYMLDTSMSKSEKRTFNCVNSIPGILDFMHEHYGLDFSEVEFPSEPQSSF